MILDFNEISRRSEDLDRMVAILSAQGHSVSRLAVFLAWANISLQPCASWLSLDDDEEIVFAMLCSSALEKEGELAPLRLF